MYVCFNTVQVIPHGFFLVGCDTPPDMDIPTIPGDKNINIIAPFAADIDLTLGGSLQYSLFLTNFSGIQTVSSFIRSHTNNSFYGVVMMVAEWRNVRKRGGDPVSS